MSSRRRYEASPTDRLSSIRIPSRSIKAASRNAFDRGGTVLRIVFPDRLIFPSPLATLGSSSGQTNNPPSVWLRQVALQRSVFVDGPTSQTVGRGTQADSSENSGTRTNEIPRA